MKKKELIADPIKYWHCTHIEHPPSPELEPIIKQHKLILMGEMTFIWGVWLEPTERRKSPTTEIHFHVYDMNGEVTLKTDFVLSDVITSIPIENGFKIIASPIKIPVTYVFEILKTNPFFTYNKNLEKLTNLYKNSSHQENNK